MHLLVSTFLLTLLLSLPVLAEAPVVASVDGKNITLDEFNRRYDEVLKKVSINPPTKKAFLEDLAKYEMGVQEAEKRNLAKDPVIAERIRQELYAGLIEKDLKDKLDNIPISDDEMKTYYQNNPEVRTSHILIEVKPGATEAERGAARKRADEIASEVKKSKRPFEELVKLYTDDLATKRTGGDIGFQSRISLIPGFSLAPSYYDTALHLKAGEISNVVETPYGFHIIKLLAKKGYADANKRSIRAAIFEKKKMVLFNDYFDKLKKNHKIVLHPEVIK